MQEQLGYDNYWWFGTGNGSQWPKMGRELIEQNATFRESIKICASVLTPLGLDLLEAFEKEDGFSEARLAAVGLASVQVTHHSVSSSYVECLVLSESQLVFSRLFDTEEQKGENASSGPEGTR